MIGSILKDKLEYIGETATYRLRDNAGSGYIRNCCEKKFWDNTTHYQLFYAREG